MIVNSKQLDDAAQQLRSTGVPHALLKGNVRATPAQLETAARLLRESEPSVIEKVNRRRVKPIVNERPGFIESERQDGSNALTFQIGILPSREHRIAPDGRVIEAA